MAAETEGIGNGYLYVCLNGFIGNVIQAVFFQFVFRFRQVDRRVDDTRFNRHGADDGFNGAAGAQQMACHGLRRADEKVFRMVAENAGNGFRFVQIVQVRRRAVGIDIIDVAYGQTCVVDSQLNALGLLNAFGARSRNVVGVGVAAVAAQFTVNVGAALPRGRCLRLRP